MDTNKVVALTKAIAYNENGGKPTVAKEGKSGEMKSIFQYTPDTWKNYSTQMSGQELPMTPDNETAVTMKKVKDWLEKGYTEQQILSMWNAGIGEPDAYSGKFSDGTPSNGKNKYGVDYDVKGYVDNGMKHFESFQKEGQAPEASKQPPQAAQVANATQAAPKAPVPVQAQNKPMENTPKQNKPRENGGLVQKALAARG